eukprot:354894-Chlamydomonas_euryale.AAC.3
MACSQLTGRRVLANTPASPRVRQPELTLSAHIHRKTAARPGKVPSMRVSTRVSPVRVPSLGEAGRAAKQGVLPAFFTARAPSRASSSTTNCALAE